jgi:hypothetical protein
MLSVSNQIDTSTPYTWTFAGTTYSYQLDRGYAVTNTSFSPLFRLGVTLFPDRLVSLRSDVAYVGYANTASAAGQAFDLGFSGVMFREMLQVRL